MAEVSTAQPLTPLLKTLVFAGGFTSIGVELTASRLLAPYFGSSTFIWASLIGLTLAFLALGYVLGGQVADRWPRPEILYALAIAAAGAIAVIPVVARPLLASSLNAFATLDAGAFYGSLAGTLLLLAPPVTLLGFISPFAVRLQLHSVAAAGRTAGSLYALSTAGSILGSFLPVLVFIPAFGTAKTFLTLSAILLVPALVGLATWRWQNSVLAGGVFAILLLAVILVTPASVRPADRGVVLDERESAYNYIQVAAIGETRYLIMNDGHAVHSIYDPEQLLTGGPWDYFAVAPLFVDRGDDPAPESALLIGLAGGTAARQLTTIYGPIPIDGVEIDPEIAAVARVYFALDEFENVNVTIADGRYSLQTATRAYDLIGIDAYRQPYIPFQLTTREFFQEVAEHLHSGGVVVVNAGRSATDFRLVDALSTTMRDVFPHVVAVDVARYNNTMLLASKDPLSLAALERNVDQLSPSSPAREVAAWSVQSGNFRLVEPGEPVFTDDHAPVEMVIDQMIFDAARAIGGP
jgi:predicted membrane-bound spermidine synthase